MRLWLRISAEDLRRALVELLARAGHEVFTAPEPPSEVDLQIRTEAGEVAAQVGRPTLFLRPGAGLSPDADPAAALRSALRSGGIAVWASPLDAALLVRVLGGEARPTPAASREPDLEGAPGCWFVVDLARRRVVWANAAACDRHPVSRTSESPVPDELPEAVFHESSGLRRTAAGNDAVWWTVSPGHRCVALLDRSLHDAGEAEGSHRALAEIGRMTATFAHEVRNPIASLAGAIDLLREDLSASERHEVVTLARERLAGMRRLLDDMLRLARPMRELPEVFDVATVVRTAVGGTRTDPLFAGVETSLDLDANPVLVRAHAEPLRQAVANLLLNAAEAQEGKGTIRVSVRVEGRDAVLRVEDSGPGIPANNRERVFDPFWTTKAGGTGLGLALVRRVAEAAGGRASVEESGRGARLRVDLPLAAPGAAAASGIRVRR